MTKFAYRLIIMSCTHTHIFSESYSLYFLYSN
jgi:hypothetical protein